MIGAVIVIWVLNLFLSIWNAYTTGKVWVEARHAGGGRRFMAWMGYLMASLGFSWNILLLAALVLRSTGVMTHPQVELFIDTGYVLVIPGFLFSGYAIMFQSWANAYRNHSVRNMGVAAYNTFANLYNAYSAINSFPKASASAFKPLPAAMEKTRLRPTLSSYSWLFLPWRQVLS
jgi:hypothetical protein